MSVCPQPFSTDHSRRPADVRQTACRVPVEPGQRVFTACEAFLKVAFSLSGGRPSVCRGLGHRFATTAAYEIFRFRL